MGNNLASTSSAKSEEFTALGIQFHPKRWRLYDQQIAESLGRQGRRERQFWRKWWSAMSRQSGRHSRRSSQADKISNKEQGDARQDGFGPAPTSNRPSNAHVTSQTKQPKANRPTSLNWDNTNQVPNGVCLHSYDLQIVNNTICDHKISFSEQGTGQPSQSRLEHFNKASAGGCGSSEALDDAKPEWQRYATHVENLVMSGGGGKGYSFIGSLKALDDCGVLSRLRRVAGSSVGGICAGLVAIGCSPQEIADIFSVDNRWLFQDQSCTPVYCVPNVMKKFGVHPADRFYRIYGGHIARKTGDADTTFKQLYDQTGRELCIVVTNLNKMCAEYCHPKTTPDMPVRLAVRMTMSFPVLYQPVQCELNGVTSWYTDGGILDQFPIHIFDGGILDTNHNASTPVGEGEESFNPHTLGLYVVGETALDYQIWRSLFGQEIPYHPSYVPNTKLSRSKLKHELDVKDDAQKLSPIQKQAAMAASLESVFAWPGSARHVSISKFGDYLGATIEALLVQQRKLLIKPRDVCRTVPVNAGYIGTNDYMIEPGDREFMIRQGYESVRRFMVDHMDDPPSNSVTSSQMSKRQSSSAFQASTRKSFRRTVSIETQV